MLRIGLLADHPDMAPFLASAFEREWPDYYATQGEGAAERELSSGVWLVAIEDETPVGVIALRARVLPEIDHLTPALGGLLVAPNHRRKGAGGRLVQAATSLAKARGDKRLYTATVGAAGLVERQGWRAVDTVDHCGEPISIFAVDL